MQHIAEDESARAQQHAGDDDADDCGDDDQQNFQRISPAQLKSVTLDHLRRRALAALGRVTNGRSWEDWKVIGAYIEAGLNEAVRTSQSNAPVGIRFNQALAYWFTCNPRFRDGIEKNERNDLMRCLENMPAIDAFLDSLDPHKRRQINHPSSLANSTGNRQAAPRHGSAGESISHFEHALPHVENPVSLDHDAIRIDDNFLSLLAKVQFDNQQRRR